MSEDIGCQVNSNNGIVGVELTNLPGFSSG
jgi:hypothetical protein